MGTEAQVLAMTNEERLSIIEQLALITGYNRSVFEKMSDKKLMQELEERLWINKQEGNGY